MRTQLPGFVTDALMERGMRTANFLQHVGHRTPRELNLQVVSHVGSKHVGRLKLNSHDADSSTSRNVRHKNMDRRRLETNRGRFVALKELESRCRADCEGCLASRLQKLQKASADSMKCSKPPVAVAHATTENRTAPLRATLRCLGALAHRERRKVNPFSRRRI